MLQFNQYMRSEKISFIIYADLNPSSKKIQACANNSEIPSPTKIDEYIPCRCSMSTIWLLII